MDWVVEKTTPQYSWW